jgi:hypothetical protein
MQSLPVVLRPRSNAVLVGWIRAMNAKLVLVL